MISAFPLRFPRADSWGGADDGSQKPEPPPGERGAATRMAWGVPPLRGACGEFHRCAAPVGSSGRGSNISREGEEPPHSNHETQLILYTFLKKCTESFGFRGFVSFYAANERERGGPGPRCSYVSYRLLLWRLSPARCSEVQNGALTDYYSERAEKQLDLPCHGSEFMITYYNCNNSGSYNYNNSGYYE